MKIIIETSTILRKLPKIEVVEIEIFDIKFPKVVIPKVEVPEIVVPKVEVPDIEVPKFVVPKIEVSNIEIPETEVPRLLVPKIEVPDIEIPDIEIPETEVPRIVVPKIEVPDIEIPEMEVPKVPDIEIPEMEVPKVPDIEMEVPKVPEIEVPEIVAANNEEYQRPNLPVSSSPKKGKNENTSLKRQNEDTEGETSPKRLKTLTANANTTKNPIVILNEIRPGSEYKLLKVSGPIHAPTFTISVKVDGQIYVGRGSTKKKAKADAAQNALLNYVQVPDSAQTVASVDSDIDFTADIVIQREENGTEQVVQEKSLAPTNVKISDIDKGPVLLLNEMFPGIVYTCTTLLGDPFSSFKTTCEIKGNVFTGTGSSKKHSKTAAAKSALSKFLNKTSPVLKSKLFFTNNASFPQEIVDTIGRLVHDKLSSLLTNDSCQIKRKVFAGIVMTKNDERNPKNAELIAATTGTKCISGERISMQGASLNDMHAEIVARRCCLLFFYDQLLLLTDPEKASESIFMAREEGVGYKLKPNIKFHLYINTAPCGDARIFSPHDKQAEMIDKHPNRKARGQLRTKIESGEGTIPVKSSNSIQTWDGILQGERLVTMSCSDKLARWNVVGLQGSLLTHFIEPIYFESIVLGSLLQPEHLYRAMAGRIEETLQGLPPPYRLTRPMASLTSSCEIRATCKAPNISENWILGQSNLEVVNTTTGKTDTDNSSRICKAALFKRFLYLLPHLTTITGFKSDDNSLLYADVKNAVESYNSAKQMLYNAFEKADLGHWIKKPMEQDQFEMFIDNV